MTVSVAATEEARSKRVELIIRQLESLPTLPVVAAKLLRATTAKDSSIREIISLIESDQSLTAKILALTRRAHLGLGNTITTVEKAVLMLGLDVVRNAVLSIQVFETFGPREGGAEERTFNRLEFWKHSLAVACAAQLIVEHRRSSRLDPDEVFVCGLLHDLGKVVFDTCLPKSFDRVVRIAESNRASIADVERRILGLDHSAIGKKLAQQWQLPDPILHSIWLHHHKSAMLPENIKHRDLIDVIYLADLVAREQRIGLSGNYVFIEHSEPFAKQLGVTANDYQKILLELRTRMSQRAGLIGLDELTTEELYQQALQLANAELGKVNQSLTDINRRLKARARYFDVISEVNRKLKPDMSVGEILEHAAQSIRSALNLPAVVVYRHNQEKGFLEAAFANAETCDTQLFEAPGEDGPPSEPAGGPFLIDPPAFLEPLVTHYAKRLGNVEVKLIGLVSADRTIGGILLACDHAGKERLVRERPEIEALVTACSLALGQSLVIEAKETLAQDLLVIATQARELEQQLVKIKCLAALGELAAGAAHELNNPLAIASGRAQLLRDREHDPETTKSLEIIIQQTHRASEIISELMEFTRPPTPQPQTVDLGQVCEKVVEQSAHQITADRVTLDLQPEAKTAWCDPQHLEAALKELITNAVNAAAEAGQADLKIKIATVAEDDRKHVQIRVQDNGPGMELEVLAKAFDLFFSSHKAGRRRGLGLSRVYRNVQANNGAVWLESQTNVGTTAFLRLPSRTDTA